MELQQYLRERNAMVDAALDRWLPEEEDLPGEIHRAMRYSLFAGGKRLRPILVLASTEIIGGSLQQALPAACSLELIHTYSLIHDDLPAMDDDDMRRGRPSNHIVFGEAIAVLAGDALLTFAFELLIRESLQAGVQAQTLSKITAEMAAAAGTSGMIGGQVLDLAAEDQRVDLCGLEQIHRWKTGALLQAAVRMGAIVAGAGEKELTALTRYAKCLGLAFQIKDDILDIEGDSIKLGKLTGSDTANNKSTYPSLLGLDKAKILLDEQIKLALAAIEPFGEQSSILAQLALFVRDRES